MEKQQWLRYQREEREKAELFATQHMKEARMLATFGQRAEQAQQEQFEKELQRERTLMNVHKAYRHEATRREEQNAKQRAIDDRVQQALARKEEQLDKKR